MDVNPPDAAGVRMRPVGAAIMRPIGAVASPGVGTELSNHEATAFNLQARGVDFRMAPEQPTPDLQKCHAAFRAALPDNNSEWQPDIFALLLALQEQYPSGSGANQGETAFDVSLFEALRTCLGDMVADTETKNVSGRSIIVLKGDWKVDGETYALGFSRQVTSEALGIPKNSGCSRTPRHDHSCVLLRKQGNERKLRVVETSATVDLKTIKKSVIST